MQRPAKDLETARDSHHIIRALEAWKAVLVYQHPIGHGLLIPCVTSSGYSKGHTGPRHWCFGERGSGRGGPGSPVELWELLAQPQGDACAEILLDLLTHELEAGNCVSLSYLDTSWSSKCIPSAVFPFLDLSHSSLALLPTSLGIFLTWLCIWESVCCVVSLEENQFPHVLLFATTCGPRVDRAKAQLSACTKTSQEAQSLWSFPLCASLSWTGCISSTFRAWHRDVLPRKSADVNTSWGLRAQRLHG